MTTTEHGAFRGATGTVLLRRRSLATCGALLIAIFAACGGTEAPPQSEAAADELRRWSVPPGQVGRDPAPTETEPTPTEPTPTEPTPTEPTPAEPAPTEPTPTPAPLYLDPPSASVVAGQTVQFTATAGGAVLDVTWVVQEGAAGGAIGSTGLYKAPSAAGTYHVVATSRADFNSKAVAKVTVIAAPAPEPTPVPVPGDVSTWPDVRSFGAVGDGVTDDTAAFVRAGASQRPFRVSRPSAFYKVSSVIRIYASVAGDGSMPEIRMTNPSGDWSDSIFQVRDYNGTAPLVISGLHLNGGWTGTESAEHSHCIIVGGSQNVIVENNLLVNPRGDGVYIGSSSPGSPGTKSRNITVRNNDIRNPRRCNVAVINVDGVTITGNKMQKSNNFVTAIDIEPNPNGSDTAWNVTIDGNTFTSPNAVAVMAYHSSGWPYPPGGLGGNIRISNNSGDASRGVSIVGTWSNITQVSNAWR